MTLGEKTKLHLTAFLYAACMIPLGAVRIAPADEYDAKSFNRQNSFKNYAKREGYGRCYQVTMEQQQYDQTF